MLGCVKTMERTNPLDGKTLPMVTTNPIYSYGSTSAVGSGTIISYGGLPVSSKGILWSTTANFQVLTMPKNSNGNGEPTFTTTLSALTPAIKYYYRAFAENLVGTAYGNELSFTTKSDTPYIITTVPNPILFNNTVTGGNVTAENGSTVTSRGLVYSEAPYPTRELSTVKNDTSKASTGAFTITLTNLKPAVTYYARAFAINSIGRSYGNQVIFFVPATTPTYTTLNATYGTTTASSGGTFVSNGGSAVTDKGIVWSTTPIAATTPIASLTNKVSKGGGDVSFTADMTNLLPGTPYYVYAYSINAAGTSYGSEVKFTTNAIPPTVNSGSYSKLGSTSVEINSTITNIGGSAITEFGHVYSMNAGPSLTNGGTKVISPTLPNIVNNTNYNNPISNLKANTQYYIKAYATNTKGTGYGDDIVIKTTGTTPTVTIIQPSASQLTDVSALLTGSITDNGGSSITSAGIYWSLTPGVTSSNTAVATTPVPQTNISSTINGLTTNTTYYAKAYAGNSNGVSLSSNEISFTTLDNTPQLSISSITVNSDNTVNVNAKVTSQGLNSSSLVDSKGIILGSTSTIIYNTASIKSPSQGTGSGDIVYLFSSLNPGTTYYARAYASNNKGVSYGYSTAMSFKTNAVAPTVVTFAPSNISTSGINVSGEVINEGGDPVTDAGFVWGVSTTSFNLGNSGTKGSGLGTFSFTIPTTNFVKGTRYYYRSYAKNSKFPIVYGDIQSFLAP